MAAFDIFSPPLPAEAHTTQWRNLHPGERPQAMVQAARELAATRQAPLLVITDSSEQGEQLRRELLFYSGNQKGFPVYLFPDWETLPYDVFSPHQDIISERLNALYHLPMMRSGILIVPANSLMQRLPPAAYIQQHSLMLRCGQDLDVDAFRTNLVAAGYQHVESVFELSLIHI